MQLMTNRDAKEFNDLARSLVRSKKNGEISSSDFDSLLKMAMGAMLASHFNFIYREQIANSLDDVLKKLINESIHRESFRWRWSVSSEDLDLNGE